MQAVEPSPTSIDPAWVELALLALLAAAYVIAVRRVPASVGQRVSFASGVVLAVALFVSPVDTLARTYLLSAHLFQNVALAEWVPLLLVAGLPRPLLLSLGRAPVVRSLTRPFVALPLWLLTYVTWHVPAVYEAALRRPGSLLVVEHVTYVLAGALLWWPVLGDRWEGRSGAKAVYLLLAFLLSGPIGLVFVLAPDAVYGFYEDAARVWGISALTDQRIAGALMSLGEAIVFFAAFALFFLRFLEEEAREARPGAG